MKRSSAAGSADWNSADALIWLPASSSSGDRRDSIALQNRRPSSSSSGGPTSTRMSDSMCSGCRDAYR